MEGIISVWFCMECVNKINACHWFYSNLESVCAADSRKHTCGIGVGVRAGPRAVSVLTDCKLVLTRDTLLS